MFESELVVKKEPHKGCLSTMEAVARALRLLEPEGSGAQIEEPMIRVLRAMVAFQSDHLQHHLRSLYCCCVTPEAITVSHQGFGTELCCNSIHVGLFKDDSEPLMPSGLKA
ncbi:hypothetical protein ZWY2020_040262 [Hordeum vulgare]|nr:hypothetical protein ZWY2020_040262 [Hordeum vulgare]